MNITIVENLFEFPANIIRERIEERIPVVFGENGMQIALHITPQIGPEESYQIAYNQGVWDIIGSDHRGLIYGIGKFLHSAEWSETEFAPKETTGVVSPACPFRAVYFANHFYNWYQTAPLDELKRYLEDLTLWGYNTIHSIFPIINFDSLEDDGVEEAVSKTKELFQAAKQLGLKISFGHCLNQGMKGAPHQYDADFSYDKNGERGTAGRNLCPSNKEALHYLRTLWTYMLEQFKDIGLDYFIFWPYDEGGCGCESCSPWGANGYLKLAKYFYQDAITMFPNMKFIVGTWLFDTPYDQGEYDGLYKELKGEMSWTSYLMVDSHGDFPEYPLKHDVVKPIVNFPEISMWKLYPWGGFGANPMPKRYQRFWDSAKSVLKGGMPYSEGIYEDISKIQCVGYYWNPDKGYKEILEEYIRYEYDPSVCDMVLEMMECIENNHDAVGIGNEPTYEQAKRAAELAKLADGKMGIRAKKRWRWRILYIRAILDEKRYGYYVSHGMKGQEDLITLRRFGGDFLAEDETAQDLFRELRQIYHCVEYNRENQYTLPPLGGNTVFGAAPGTE